MFFAIVPSLSLSLFVPFAFMHCLWPCRVQSPSFGSLTFCLFLDPHWPPRGAHPTAGARVQLGEAAPPLGWPTVDNQQAARHSQQSIDVEPPGGGINLPLACIFSGESTKKDGNNTSWCSDKGVVCASREKT